MLTSYNPAKIRNLLHVEIELSRVVWKSVLATMRESQEGRINFATVTHGLYTLFILRWSNQTKKRTLTSCQFPSEYSCLLGTLSRVFRKTVRPLPSLPATFDVRGQSSVRTAPSWSHLECLALAGRTCHRQYEFPVSTIQYHANIDIDWKYLWFTHRVVDKKENAGARGWTPKERIKNSILSPFRASLVSHAS